MDSALAAMLVGGVSAAVVLLFLAMSRKPVKCPGCGREQPRMRTPTSMQQMMWGGSTCQACGAEMDGRGKLKAKKS